jgi:hypothetical protein
MMDRAGYIGAATLAFRVKAIDPLTPARIKTAAMANKVVMLI